MSKVGLVGGLGEKLRASTTDRFSQRAIPSVQIPCRRQGRRGVKYLHQGLGGLLMFCVIIRVAVWLLAPALPLVVMLFVVAILVHLIGWGSRL